MTLSAFAVANDGMVTFAPAGLQILRSLEHHFLTWAAECGAAEMRFPPLIRVSDLELFDYFKNFPHIVSCACAVNSEQHQAYAQKAETITAVPPAHLSAAEHALLPAACYNIYLHHRERVLPGPLYVTTVAQCFRNEAHYQALERLRGFTMREIVCIGSQQAVLDHLRLHREKVLSLVRQLELPCEIDTASDPFFDRLSERALTAQLFPTKEEVLYRGKVAIASINFHRNFFGERCRIHLQDGYAFTGCVAFGLERWLHALLDRFDQRADEILNALADLETL